MRGHTEAGEPRIDPELKAELDGMLGKWDKGSRWTPEALAVLRHYHFERKAPVGLMVRIMARAYPQFSWSYAIVNGKIQSLKRKET